MKKLFLNLLIGLSLFCSAQTITVIEKNERFIAPIEMVAMDKYTFGKYHFISEKYDTLKKKCIEMDSLLVQRDSFQSNLIKTYEEVLVSKNQEVNTYREGYEIVRAELITSIDRNTQLQLDYRKLEQKNKRVKRWRNIFLGSTFFSTGILVLIVAL